MLKVVNPIKNLFKNSEFKKYLINTSWLYCEKFFKIIVSFFVVIMVTRYLGPDKFGIISYAQSFVGIFLALSSLGLDVLLVREIAKNKENSSILIGTAFFMKTLVGIVCILIILALSLINYDKETFLYINVISLSLIFYNFRTIDTYFQANVLGKYSAIANTISFLISSLGKILLVLFQMDLIYFCILIVIDAMTISISYICIYKKMNNYIYKWKFDKKIALLLMQKSWPLLLTAFAAFIYTRIDQLMLKHIISSSEVGEYAAALKICDILNLLPFMIVSSVYPKLISLKEISESAYMSLIANLYKLLTWISIPMVLILTLYSEEIIKLLYGVRFTEASDILFLLSFSIILISIGSLTTKILYVESYEKKYLVRSIIGMILNIVLNFFMIPILGGKGAALSTLITLFFIYYIYDIFDRDLHRYFIFKVLCFVPINYKIHAE